MSTADQSKWKYILKSVSGSVPVGAGEVPSPSQRTYGDPLNGMRQAGFVLNMDNPRVPWLLNNDALCEVWRRNRTDSWDHLVTGDVLTTEEDDDGNTGQVTVTVVDPFWRLTRRLIGTAVGANHQATGFLVGTPSVPVDLSLAAQQIVQAVNTDFFSGLNIGAITLCGTLSVVGPIYADFAGTNIQTISSTLGGPDFWIDPIAITGAMPNTAIGQINIGGPIAGARGQYRPLAIFEFGMGKHNVQSYKRLLTKQGVANHVIAPPPGWPTSIAATDSVAIRDDTASQNAIGRFDDVAGSDVSSIQLRNILVQEEVAVRKQKQQQITFIPTVDNPMDYRVDYDVGDVVTARAYDQASKSFRFNGSIRVYGVSITVGDNDEETISLTLVPDSAAGGVS